MTTATRITTTHHMPAVRPNTQPQSDGWRALALELADNHGMLGSAKLLNMTPTMRGMRHFSVRRTMDSSSYDRLTVQVHHKTLQTVCECGQDVCGHAGSALAYCLRYLTKDAEQRQRRQWQRGWNEQVTRVNGAVWRYAASGR